MDDRFEAAMKQANFRLTFENQKEKYKERFKNDLIYSCDGAYFKLGAELLSEIQLHRSEGKNSAILLDINLNPIRIQDLEQFYSDTRNAYAEATNRYAAAIARLGRTRDVAGLAGFDIEDDKEE